MPSRVVSSWGNVIRGEHALFRLKSRRDRFPDIAPTSSVLPFGNGRSYGDSCLNLGGGLLQTRSLDRFIGFDRESGVLACEPGVLLADILQLAVPAGWFLPVVPGTQYVTVGGAIANNVHGKNHHAAGTFGRHVRRFELLRSTGERLVCSPDQNPAWFSATVGGLGLTGVITSAELQLRRITSPWMDVESIRFANLDEFFRLSEESDRDFEYTVSWIDCLARGRSLGRGLLQRANHAQQDPRAAEPRAARLAVPFMPPVSLVNPVSLRLFNTFHYHRQRSQVARSAEYYQSFFFPLDGIQNWNRLYGPRGFYQYQCVVPTVWARKSTGALLEAIAGSGLGSFLAVLKRCGSLDSPGMLSFPLPGVTLALDFPNTGAPLGRLFDHLDQIVSAAGGRLYPAKDGRMPRALFQSGYPRWREFSEYIDPKCSSTFWRRVGEDPPVHTGGPARVRVQAAVEDRA
jgi:FAD/FMN-containing dehydrogenase